MTQTRRFVANTGIALILGMGISLALSWSLGAAPGAPAAELHVCPAGPPTCDYGTIQAAVDAATPGDVIKVAAGTYSGVQGRPAPAGYSYSSVVTQVVYVSKTVAIQGGYTTATGFADPPDPVNNPTTVDAQTLGRALFITGDARTATL
jgi:pectin methylesterase-like acyl-CoA thioesterase